MNVSRLPEETINLDDFDVLAIEQRARRRSTVGLVGLSIEFF